MGIDYCAFYPVLPDEWHYFMINMLRNLGWIDGFMALWFHNWMISWAIAFPIVVTLLPFVRKFTGLLVDMSGSQPPK